MTFEQSLLVDSATFLLFPSIPAFSNHGNGHKQIRDKRAKHRKPNNEQEPQFAHWDAVAVLMGVGWIFSRGGG